MPLLGERLGAFGVGSATYVRFYPLRSCDTILQAEPELVTGPLLLPHNSRRERTAHRLGLTASLRPEGRPRKAKSNDVRQ